MEFTKKFVSVEEIEAPQTLYKYRDWNSDLHKTIITEQTVFMSPPSLFDDKKELRNYKRYDLMTDQQVYDKYMDISKKHHLSYTRNQHRAYAREMTKHPPFRNPKVLQQWQEDNFNEYDKKVGILSLTAYNDNLAMWNCYADNGNGFCVGFDTSVLFKYMGAGCEVTYCPDGLPIINHDDSWEIHRWKEVYNKEEKWSFEREYRVDTFKKEDFRQGERSIKLPRECFTDIVFGWGMDATKRQVISAFCRGYELSVQYYEAVVIEERVIIKAVDI